MKYVITIENKEYEVEVDKGQARLLRETAVSPPTTHPVVLPPATPTVPAQANAPAPVSTSEVVTAPMPGTVLDVKVTVASRVKRGDLLVLLEAMKMENEIVAPREGTIIQIVTVKGASVGTGAPLIVIQ